MGDRCYMTVNASRAGIEALSKSSDDEERDIAEMFLEGDSGKGSTVEWEDDQANYGETELRMSLAAGGVDFCGSHGDGCEYPGYAYVCIDGKQFEVVETNGGGPCVQCDRNGPNAAEVEEVRAYYAALDEFERRYPDCYGPVKPEALPKA